MSPTGHTAEVTCLSPRVTEKDIYDFFALCGAIEHVDLVRYSSYMTISLFRMYFIVDL